MNTIVTRICLVLTLAFPMLSQAAITTDKMAAACKAKNPGCLAYTMGGADRYWLVEGKHESCDVASDKKTIEQVKKAAQSSTGFYATKEKQAAVVPLLNYLASNKLQSCALTMNFADLTAQCISKIQAQQVSCHAYIAGVMDVATAMDRLHQKEVEKAPVVKSPFCENGKRKEQINDAEVMKAISDFGQSKEAGECGHRACLASRNGSAAEKIFLQSCRKRSACVAGPCDSNPRHTNQEITSCQH